MSPDELALLRAVDAAPANDLPRLVYADWLDEHGHAARAEFIRLQCEIAKLSNAEAHRNVRLFVRHQELLDEHLPELLDAAADVPVASRPEFDRGFVNSLTVTAEGFAMHAQRISSLIPLPQVRITAIAPPFGSFITASEPYLSCVTAMELAPSRSIRAGGWPDFVASSLRRASAWDRLEVLEAEECHMGDEGATHLLREGNYPRLTHVDLSGNDLTDAGVIDLLNSGLPQRLERLVLGWNPLTDQSAFELADRLGRNSRLKYLNLRLTNITRFGQDAILTRFPGKVDLF
ncbi:MAG: TIGR02996 domain-containing protein [Fimbriiglobus sp.]